MARCSTSAWWDGFKSSLLRQRDEPLYLSDSNVYDFSEDPRGADDEDLPRFSELRVVVAAAPGKGGTLSSHDDSMQDRDLPNACVQPSPCERCTEHRELSKQQRVRNRLVAAVGLYLVFMVGELVGKVRFHRHCQSAGQAAAFYPL